MTINKRKQDRRRMIKLQNKLGKTQGKKVWLEEKELLKNATKR